MYFHQTLSHFANLLDQRQLNLYLLAALVTLFSRKSSTFTLEAISLRLFEEEAGADNQRKSELKLRQAEKEIERLKMYLVIVVVEFGTT